MNGKRERLEQIREQIRSACLTAGRREEEVCLLAVSKTKPWEDIRDFAALGVRDFGENYIQEALPKVEALANAPIRWHFIGHLQSNKAKLVPGVFSLFHGLSSLSLAEKLARAAGDKGLIQDCLIEVNVDGEESKAGLAPEALPSLLEKLALLPQLRVRGLMCIPDPALSRSPREPFARLRELLEATNRAGAHPPLKELSMGMSGDFAEAILEGATIVRIGTALFGERR